MKNYYFAIITCENGKNFATVEKACESDNLLAVFERVPNIIAANLRPTKKAAEELAAFWNECYKNNGTYLFG